MKKQALRAIYAILQIIRVNFSVRSVVLLVKGRNRTALAERSGASNRAALSQSEATERIMNCLSALPLLRASASLENYEL